jgi:DNA-binding MarR family transcriptional regulator
MARTTPQPDVTELVQALGLLVRRLRVVGGSPGLSWTDAIVVRRLDKEGPATTAELAREVGVKPQSMGTTVATLLAKGLVERRPHPTDKRQVNIVLSSKGRAMRKSSGDARRSWLEQAITRLEPREREALFAAGETLKRLAQS